MVYTKQSFLIFCIISYWNIHSTPIYASSNNDYIKQHFIQPAQKHPKKTITGIPLLGYGLKLIYEGSKTRNRPKDYNGTYSLIGIGTEVIGGILIAIGAKLLYPVVWDMIFPENTDTEKTDQLKIPDKK